MRLRALTAIAIAFALVLGGATLSDAPAHAASGACPNVYYRATNTSEASQRWALVAVDDASNGYVADLRWCRATQFSQITNDSAAAWIVGGATITPRGPSVVRRMMRAQVAAASADEGRIAPAYILPGETVAIGPGTFTLAIDPELTRLWIAFSAIGEPLIEFLDLVTAEAAPKWNAAWKCAQGAVSFVETAALDQITIEQVIEAAYDVPETAKSCRELASEAKRINGQRAARAVVLTPADDLIRAAYRLDDVPNPALGRSLLDAYCLIVPQRLGC